MAIKCSQINANSIVKIVNKCEQGQKFNPETGGAAAVKSPHVHKGEGASAYSNVDIWQGRTGITWGKMVARLGSAQPEKPGLVWALFSAELEKPGRAWASFPAKPEKPGRAWASFPAKPNKPGWAWP